MIAQLELSFSQRTGADGKSLVLSPSHLIRGKADFLVYLSRWGSRGRSPGKYNFQQRMKCV